MTPLRRRVARSREKKKPRSMRGFWNFCDTRGAANAFYFG
jgi:hypothetical protein